MIQLGVEARTDIRESLVLTDPGLERVDPRRVSGEIDEQNTPCVGLVEGTPQSDTDSSLHDARAQNLVTTLFKSIRRSGKFMEFRDVAHIVHL